MRLMSSGGVLPGHARAISMTFKRRSMSGMRISPSSSGTVADAMIPGLRIKRLTARRQGEFSTLILPGAGLPRCGQDGGAGPGPSGTWVLRGALAGASVLTVTPVSLANSSSISCLKMPFGNLSISGKAERPSCARPSIDVRSTLASSVSKKNSGSPRCRRQRGFERGRADAADLRVGIFAFGQEQESCAASIFKQWQRLLQCAPGGFAAGVVAVETEHDFRHLLEQRAQVRARWSRCRASRRSSGCRSARVR